VFGFTVFVAVGLMYISAPPHPIPEERHYWWAPPKSDVRFRREVDENCALLGYYVTSSGNSLPTFRDNLSFPS
jgi:hypothetical protein